MNELLLQLAEAVQPPALFTPSDAPFWDDEHIARRMLAAHLDPEFDGASRRPEFMDRSADFIQSIMPPGSFPRLLDVGCGPGLYAQRLCRRGYAVTGLDISRGSIAFARRQAQEQRLEIQYQVQNYLQWQPEEGVADAAVMIYCDYGALHPEGRQKLMAAVYDALVPGGRFLLDVFTEAKLKQFKEERWWQHCPKGGFWSAEPYMALFANRLYTGMVSLEQTVLIQPGGLRTHYLWTQFFRAEQMAREAEQAGFAVLDIYGDVAGSPLNEGPTAAVLLEKPPAG